jgi:hypothetical protein
MRHCAPNFFAGSSFLSHSLRTVVLETLRRSATSETFIISRSERESGGFCGVLGGRESLIVAEAYQDSALCEKMS